MSIHIEALKEAIAIKKQIEKLEERLSRLLSGKALKETATPEVSRKKRKRKMSAEGRARIAAAQKKRWAAFKKQA